MNLSRYGWLPLVASLVQPALAQTAPGLPLLQGCDGIAAQAAGKAPAPAAAAFPPLQLEIRTPLAPTLLPSAGRNYLIYELHLQNFSDDAMTLRGIDVLDGGSGAAAPLTAIAGPALEKRLRLLGAPDGAPPLVLGAGQGAIVFMCVAFDHAARVPATLRHRVLTAQSFADGPPITMHASKLHTLGAPLQGAGWTADNGPGLASHHRTGVFVAGGVAQLSRRYAFDWKKYRNGMSYSGDARDVHAYFAYGQNVIAVADGIVVGARDGIPDNVPRTKDGFTPAQPITMDNISGNFVTIGLGDNQYAQYVHLQPGSVSVKTGQRVRRGDVIGRINASGDAREPHLHFQVASAPDILASEGLPYVIDKFRMHTGEGKWETRIGEFPLHESVIEF